MVEAKHAPRGPEVGLLLLKLRKSTVVGVPQGPPAACFSIYYSVTQGGPAATSTLCMGPALALPGQPRAE